MYDKSADLQQQKINITDVIMLIIREIASRTALFRHIDVTRVLVCISSNKSRRRGATFGKLVPLRFKDGATTLRYRGRTYTMPKVVSGGMEQLYIIYFYYPKFFNMPPMEKLRVIFHELYHISPDFNGDIRRLCEVKASHGGSRKKFDLLFENEMKEFYGYISGTPYMNFLGMDTAALERSFKKVYGRRLKVPKPLAAGAAQKL